MPTYPYISGQTGLIQAFAQLRKQVPTKVDAGWLQRFSIAPANESYVISILRHLGLIDDEGNTVADTTAFFFGSDEQFKAGLENALRQSYGKLFDEMADGAFDTEREALTPWFRQVDKTSDLVGRRQASTFLTLAALAGHGEVPTVRNGTATKSSSSAPKKAAVKKAASVKGAPAATGTSEGVDDTRGKAADEPARRDVGLSVRIEVNLPAGGDAQTYDAIFASIRKHLML